jgi:hypothetical protein
MVLRRREGIMSRRRVVVMVIVAGLAGLVVATIVVGWDHAMYRAFAWTWENGPHKPGQGTGYAFVSGIGSDLGEVTLVTGLVILYRKVNCNIKGCWRIQWRTYVDADGHPQGRVRSPRASLTMIVVGRRPVRLPWCPSRSPNVGLHG